MDKLKVFVVGGRAFDNYANWIPNSEITRLYAEADIVLFCGGEDVDPDIYGEPKHFTTSYNRSRDNQEMPFFTQAKADGKYILGICRGSQLCCVMNGGKLVQHQENPLFRHNIKTDDGRNIYVTSTHHQAQFPYGLPKEDYKIIGWTENLSSYHKNGKDEELNPEKECEIVYYPKTKCLAIQSHPEFVFESENALDKEYIGYVQELLNKLVKNELQK